MTKVTKGGHSGPETGLFAGRNLSQETESGLPRQNRRAFVTLGPLLPVFYHFCHSWDHFWASWPDSGLPGLPEEAPGPDSRLPRVSQEVSQTRFQVSQAVPRVSWARFQAVPRVSWARFRASQGAPGGVPGSIPGFPGARSKPPTREGTHQGTVPSMCRQVHARDGRCARIGGVHGGVSGGGPGPGYTLPCCTTLPCVHRLYPLRCCTWCTVRCVRPGWSWVLF